MKILYSILNIRLLCSNFALLKTKSMPLLKRIAIFASGNGTNALNLVNYFSTHSYIKIATIFVNNPNASVISKMNNIKKHVFLFNKEMFYENNVVIEELNRNIIDFVVLSGFLWLFPKNILNLYKNKVINIHPALLPSYGGKGMYGNKVHETVIKNKEKTSGITIHLVNEEYDKGDIIFQATCPVFESDTPEILAQRIQQLEYFHFPKIVEAWISSLN